MWPWKVYLIGLGAAVSLAVGAIPSLLGIAWWVTAPITLAVGSLIVLKSGDRAYVADVFEKLNADQRDRTALLIRVAVAAYVLWTATYIAIPEWHLYLLAALALISLMSYGGARNEEYHITHTKSVKENPIVKEALEERKEVKKARALLDYAGHPRVRILSFKRIGDSEKGTGGKQIEVQVPTTAIGKLG